MISAFGPRAERYAGSLGDLEAVIADVPQLGKAYLEAVRRREAGTSFYGMILFDDPRVAFGYAYGSEILKQAPDYDNRCAIADQLAAGQLMVNGTRVSDAWRPDQTFEYILLEFYGLCDALLVRSFAEHARIADVYARGIVARPMRPVERVLANVTIPAPARVRTSRPGIVVWAPLRAAAELGIIVHALTEVHGEVTCVSAGGPPPVFSTGTFLLPEDPRVADALACAAVVVAADPSDPADAVAFARLGYGVVAPISSGAHEFAGTIVPWEALNARPLFAAVAVAMARPAVVHAEPVPAPREPSRPGRPAFVDELPLVSVITPTYNRPGELRKMLSCLAAQTYPNVESIVVNDGWTPVADIVAEFPFARLIDLPTNGGSANACAIGREAARGEYLVLLPDDDWFYPDHFERLMYAIMRSGCAVAHGTALLRFLERDPDGELRTAGFNATTFAQTIAPTDSLVTSVVGGHQAMIARAVYDRVGWYLPDSDVADNEIQARICKHYFYAFCDNVTAEFRDHPGGTGRNLNFATALKEVYDHHHPVTNRPHVAELRERTLAAVASRVPGRPPFAVSIRING